MSMAYIRNKHIYIKIPIDCFPLAVKASVDVGALDSAWEVTDTKVFAKEVVCALNRELDETGNTLIHKAIDEACRLAFEYGAEGVDYAKLYNYDTIKNDV
jgi:hypothetical protein